jgi:hypothetical protein
MTSHSPVAVAAEPRIMKPAITLLAFACLCACSGMAGGMPVDDAGMNPSDSSDAGDAPTDAGGPPGDSGMSVDAGPLDAGVIDAGPKDAGPPPLPDPCVAANTCPPNTWVSVTPTGITIPPEGLRSLVPDPLHPSDLFLGSGAAGIWKSTDYGNTWKMINAGFGYVAQGLCLAVLPTNPATLLIAMPSGVGKIHKSTDGGGTFRTTGGGLPGDLYSFAVDPYDGTHLISGFHEQDKIAESTDSGETWHVVVTSGFPTGGVSWYPQFIDTGAAATTRKTWLAIAQNGGSPAMTHDSGATWTIPTGLQGLTHPHGNAQIFQRGSTIFIGGQSGPAGDGVYRSTDMGATFTRVSTQTPAAVVWGTANHVYSMYAWSCYDCTINPNFMVSSASGDVWTSPAVPTAMRMGADHVAVTSDGTHQIFVAAMRNAGLWRYVEQ